MFISSIFLCGCIRKGEEMKGGYCRGCQYLLSTVGSSTKHLLLCSLSSPSTYP
uniref:Uncharacterized protein n=1 Tax=Ascaris lumbricoides TaxID=6252 RepID=A0A0M3I8K4_ASCLU